MTDSMTQMKSDLAPTHGSPLEGKQVPITRAVFAQILMYHRERVIELELVSQGCGGCIHQEHPSHCSHWKSPIPPEYLSAGCDDWTWDGVNF